MPAAPRTVTLSDPRVEQTELRRYLSGALGDHRCGRRKRRARRAGAIDGQRQQLLSLPRARRRQAARRQRQRRLSGHLARSDPVPDLGLAETRRRVRRRSSRRSMRVIADLAQNPIRAEDLERVKTQLIAEAIYAQDNQATLARWYGGALTIGPERSRTSGAGRTASAPSPPSRFATPRRNGWTRSARSPAT